MRTVLVRVQPPQPNLSPPNVPASLPIIPHDSERQSKSRNPGCLRAPCILFVKTFLLFSHQTADVLPPVGMVHWVWFGVGGGSRSEGRSCRPSPQSPIGILGASSLLRSLLFARGRPNTIR